MAYLVKPFTKAELIPAIEIAVSRFAEVTALQSEIGDLRERLAMRKLLDRAKGVLQATRGMSEPEAFRWIQKTSMDRRMTMQALAQEILDSQPSAGQPGPAQPSSPAQTPSSAQPASSAQPGNSTPPGDGATGGVA